MRRFRDSTEKAAAADGAEGLCLADVRSIAVEWESVRACSTHPIQSLATVSSSPAWVARYVRERVIAEEWPLIIRAHSLAASGNFHAILDLDLEWGGRFGTRPEAEASFRVGQRQLNRLRPLRDARVVQRYLTAIESGRAHGWHPIVFGVVLAVFGVPLRHGLLHFARQVAGGFLAESSSEPVELPHEIEHGLTTALSIALPPPSLSVV